MKSLCILLFAVIFFGSSCKPDSKSLEEFTLPKFWFDNCSNFFETHEGFTHEGRCCESVSFSKFELKRNQSFSVEGRYYRYTESSENTISNKPVKVTGFLSADAKTLTLNYEIDSEPMKYILKTADNFAICDCTCFFK